MGTTTQKVQTGLRLEPELYKRLKMNAQRQNRSFNNYVEHILSATAGLDFPRLGKAFVPSDQILGLGDTLPHYSQEEIDSDARLSYLLSK